MTTLTLIHPPRGEFGFRNRQTLDGTTYIFQFSWNLRAGFWHLALGNSSNISTVRNLQMVIASDILKPFQYNTDVPQGVLSVVDTSDTKLEAERDEFGVRVVLRYTEVEDTA
jgi:hypothetical protein